MRYFIPILILLLSLGELKSAVLTWSGASSQLWNVAGNWTTTNPSLTGDSLIFDGGSSTNYTTVNDYTGLSVNGITVQNGGLWSFSGNDLTLNGNFTTAGQVPTTWDIHTTITGNRTIGVGTNGPVRFTGNLSATGIITLSGGGSVTLLGTNNLSGGVTASSDLLFNSAAALGGGSTVTFNTSGVALTYLGSSTETITNGITVGTGFNAANRNFHLSSEGSGAVKYTGTFTNNSTAAATGLTMILDGSSTANNEIAMNIVNGAGGAMDLTARSSGLWILSGANTYTGATVVSGGILKLDANTGSLSNTTALTLGSANNGGGTFIYDNTNSSGAKSQSLAAFRFSTGANTLQSIKGGATSSTLTFSSLLARTAGGTGNFVTTGGTNGVDNSIILTGVAAGFIDQGYFFNGADYAYMNGLGTYVRAAVYGTDAGFVDAGASLSAGNHNRMASSITNQATAAVNTIKFDAAGVNNLSLANNATLTLTNGGILRAGGGSTTISGTGTANLIHGTASGEYIFRTDSSSDSLTISAPISANGTNILTKSGDGTLTLSGTNLYTGVTHVDGGILSINSNAALGAQATGAALNLNGGTLQATQTFGLFNGAAGVNNRAVTLRKTSTIDVTGSNTLTIAGVVGGAQSNDGLIKSGTGTLILSGANTYTGSTTIDGGTLNLTGTLGPDRNMTVNSGGTLAGSGTINFGNASGLTVNSGGAIAPGNGGVGTLTLSLSGTSGGVTFASGSSFNYDINAPGTSDLLSITGLRTNAAEVIFNNNNISFNDLGGLATGTYTLFTFDANNAYSGTLGTLSGLGSFGGSLTYNANSIQMAIIPLSNSGATDLVISSSITGTTSLTQSGTGSTTLIGSNTSTGTATVTNGVLVIGTSAGGNWVGDAVANGGILTGIGPITGRVTVNNSGTYTPGGSISSTAGIQQIGSLTVNPGGTFQIDIDGAIAGNGAGHHDQVSSTGGITINGGTLQARTIFTGSSGYVPVFGTRINFLTASSITGNFDAYLFSSMASGRRWIVEYQDTQMNLYAVPEDLGKDITGMSGNQKQLGSALQSIAPTAIDARSSGTTGVAASSDQGRIFSGLMKLNNEGLKTAYDQLSPEKLSVMGQSVGALGGASNSSATQRLGQIRRGDRGISFNGVSLRTLEGDYPYKEVASNHGAFWVPTQKNDRKNGFFVTTTGSYSQVDSGENRIGFENRYGGITAGIDREIMPHVTLGVFAGQGYSDALLDGGGTLEANMGRLGVYAGYYNRGFYVNSSFSGGLTSFDSKRKISFIGETAKGSTQGYDLSGQIATGLDFQTGNWVLGPVAKVDYGYQMIDGFQEHDSAARLQVSKQESPQVETGLGLRVSRPFVYAAWKWIPELRFMGSYQWYQPGEIQSRFVAGGNSFTVQPDGAGQTLWIPGAGITLLLNEAHSVNMSYESRITDFSLSHQLDLGWQMRF